MSYASDALIDAQERKIKKLRAENEKLRELARAVRDFLEDINCDGCPCERHCDDNNRMFCADNISYHAFQTMRELGIEAKA